MISDWGYNLAYTARLNRVSAAEWISASQMRSKQSDLLTAAQKVVMFSVG